MLFPFRKQTSFSKRQAVNILFSGLNSLVLILLANIIGMIVSDPGQIGLFNYLPLNATWEFILSLIILDFFIYWQHRFFHQMPKLWKIHRFHHSDLGFDTTTGIRFHPIEAAISLGTRLVTVFVFGISIKNLVLFEIILNGFAMFNHSNFSLPKRFEPWTRKILITPDVHRIHHSKDLTESNKNFGFSVSLWDYLFKTILFKSSYDLKEDNIGVNEISKDRLTTFKELLVQPFK